MEKRKSIKEQIAGNSLDFVGVQETVKKEFSISDLSFLNGQNNFDWTSLPPRGRSGGTLVGINNDSLTTISQEFGQYYIKQMLLVAFSRV